MKIIKAISKQIKEELHDAKKYAEDALVNKLVYPDLARTYSQLSAQEMEHVNMLHDCVMRLIKSYREEHGDPPAEMMAVYNFLHEEQLEEAADVKRLQDLYR